MFILSGFILLYIVKITIMLQSLFFRPRLVMSKEFLCGRIYIFSSYVKGKQLRMASSSRWRALHNNDRYVREARTQQYLTRSAFKLLQINSKYNIFCKGMLVIDCGAAPGGWSQVAAEKVASKESNALVFAVDILPMNKIPGVVALQGDFTTPELQAELLKALKNRPVDVVCSDMAPSFSGTHVADHARSMDLCYSGLKFANQVLRNGSSFVCKFLAGGTEQDLKKLLQSQFRLVKYEKPDASRKTSSEGYFICMDYLGVDIIHKDDM